MDKFVDSLVSKYMQSPQNCGLSIGVVRNGRFSYYNYGETLRDSGRLPDSATRYEMGLISCGFTGMLYAQAVYEGKVKPEADIRTYLPKTLPMLSWHEKPIRVIHLITHTSGLPSVPGDLSLISGYAPEDPFGSYTREDLMKYVATLEPDKEPGQNYEFSVTGVALLGLMLENVYQKPFSDLLREKIVFPSGMKSTSTLRTEGHMAQGYTERSEPAVCWTPDAFAPVTGVLSNTQDMLRYLDFHIRSKSREVVLNKKILYAGRVKVASGWKLKEYDGTDLYYQSGNTFGFSSFCGFSMETASGFVILSNSAMSVDYMGIALHKYLQHGN